MGQKNQEKKQQSNKQHREKKREEWHESSKGRQIGKQKKRRETITIIFIWGNTDEIVKKLRDACAYVTYISSHSQNYNKANNKSSIHWEAIFFPLFFLVRDKKSKSMRNETESEKIT